MDNQQDQFGTPNQANTGNTGRTGQNPTTPGASSTSSGASAASRKSAPTPSAQSSSQTPDAQNQTTANAGDSRQGEGQQTNAQEGTLLDTALNSGKKWIEDSGMLDSVNQLPQSLKDLGNRALDRVNGLSTTQKVVGGAILAGGIAWLATRKGKSGSSESSSYNYGRQRDAGSYGRRSYGYQAPDASTSRRPAAGTTGRSDSGAPYANSGSRYGSSGSYGNDSSTSKSSGNTGIHSGSGRSESSPSASSFTDHGSQASEHRSHSKDDGFRSIE
ncbi:hypothetical protein KB206_16175 [Microvirga sp. STS02]|uniref:hypothetical protein n=1 Tax=Hymenobacter negativus TaxID=2795026 RepID=UPI0018DBBA29|nr:MULTISPECIES: hypothetical protein [Bacteria]MBH8570431.1 hypothetical protein [Hymenobacter negativus]MBR7210170.1 hypothetical protein [Microvirga sp. STS02]